MSWGSPNDRRFLGSPGAAGAQYLSVCHSWRAAAAHPPRAGLSVPAGCCSLMPSVRPSVRLSCRVRGRGRRAPPGQQSPPPLPCPRADITAQRRSPGVTQGGRRMGGHGRMPDPLGGKGPHQHRLLLEYSTLRSLPFAPLGKLRHGWDRSPWRPPVPPAARAEHTPGAHTALPNGSCTRGWVGDAQPLAPIPAGSTAGRHRALGSDADTTAACFCIAWA